MIKGLKYALSCVLALALLASCDRGDNTAKKDLLASVGSSNLFYSDIPAGYFSGLTPSDSLLRLKSYVDDWVQSRSVYAQAQELLGPDQTTISKQVEDYRRSLYIDEYERRMLLQKLDTVVSNSEIERFYNAGQSNFLLSEPIVRALLIIVNKDNPYLNDFKKVYRNLDSTGLQDLSTLSLQAGVPITFFPEEWVPVARVQDMLPQKASADWMRRRPKSMEITDGDQVYLLGFRDWMQTGELAPLPYVQHAVKRILLKQREVEFIEKLERQALQQSLEAGVAKVYVQ